uniref:Putative deferrochelatase/peroxidase YfeX n=1 Tax=Schistosoma haematobium TaxID=6185 RepID=A0A094ZVR8_SCHHA
MCQKGKSNFATANLLHIAPQQSVLSDIKSHALYLTIHLNSNASRECLGSVGRIEKYINQICPRNMCEKYNEILYGVGFGIDYFRKISPRFRFRGIKNYEYRERSGKYGELPKTGGDIFVHAKCNDHGMLFDLAKSIIQNMPHGCVDKFEDIYGWVYRDRRDLSEFVDADEFKAKKKHKIVRQAQPFGTLSGGAGLLFIAYAADTRNFDFMLDRMTGDSDDKINDNLMIFSRCVTGNYWYFPGQLEFNFLVHNLPIEILL